MILKSSPLLKPPEWLPVSAVAVGRRGILRNKASWYSVLQNEAACCIFQENFLGTAVCIHVLLNVLLLLPQTSVEICLLFYSKEPSLCIDLLSQLLCVSPWGLHCETFLSAAIAHVIASTEIQFIKAIWSMLAFIWKKFNISIFCAWFCKVPVSLILISKAFEYTHKTLYQWLHSFQWSQSCA